MRSDGTCSHRKTATPRSGSLSASLGEETRARSCSSSHGKVVTVGDSARRQVFVGIMKVAIDVTSMLRAGTCLDHFSRARSPHSSQATSCLEVNHDSDLSSSICRSLFNSSLTLFGHREENCSLNRFEDESSCHVQRSLSKCRDNWSRCIC